jgi:aspartyl-tRNA(Asn)/glutamyl-tRNA(Gln) amidotransferase subunit C
LLIQLAPFIRSDFGFEAQEMLRFNNRAVIAGRKTFQGGGSPPNLAFAENRMSVDISTVKRVAHLARIAVNDDDAERMTGELNAILGFVEQLNEVNVDGIEPMTSVTPMDMRMRQDKVTDGGIAAAVVANAPVAEDNFFVVPKVVE